jgi:hypothetical protein
MNIEQDKEFELVTMCRQPGVPNKRALAKLRAGDAVKLFVRPLAQQFAWSGLHSWFVVEELPTASNPGTARSMGGFPDLPIQAGQLVSFGLHHVAAFNSIPESAQA